MRSCCVCGAKKPKRELVRVVRTPEGDVHIDAQGREPGRGAYVCADELCLERGRKGRKLDRALKMTIDGDVYDTIVGDLKQLLRERSL
ncbi:MAG: RNase P modulator RnpM [Coriobacteriales bacterium]|jgi:predicted RNA-binding protein YlxR (DUF448 family)